MPCIEIGTGGQPQDMFPIQLSFRKLLDILHTGGWVSVVGIENKTSQAVTSPGAPLRI